MFGVFLLFGVVGDSKFELRRFAVAIGSVDLPKAPLNLTFGPRPSSLPSVDFHLQQNERRLRITSQAQSEEILPSHGPVAVNELR